MRSTILQAGFALFFLLWAGKGFSQQDSQYTQYMYNTSTINPAYTGVRELLSINTTYRNQWVGLEGAPETLAFSMNSPVGIKGVGLGFSFISDKIGPTAENNIAADFSYSFQVSRTADLSFGLKGGLNSLSLDANKLLMENMDDSFLVSGNYTSPILGLGVYLHSDTWYVGLSSPNILKTEFEEVKASMASEKPHLYLIGGYVFELNREVKFKPAILTKAVAGAPLAVDVSANFWFQETLSLGASYRYNAAVSGLAGFQVNDNIMIGYAYDYDTTNLGNFNSGSHEIFLRFELGTRMRKGFNSCYF